MLFHWLRDYGKGRAVATGDAARVVDGVFEAARAASPDIFAADSRSEPALQAKFEHVCPWVALAVVDMDAEDSRDVLEVMVDRLEIGLREAGAGDMKVGVKVRKYAAALHGRVRRYANLVYKEEWRELGEALAEHGVGYELAGVLKSRREGGFGVKNVKKMG